jgi:hypothetical protein
LARKDFGLNNSLGLFAITLRPLAQELRSCKVSKTENFFYHKTSGGLSCALSNIDQTGIEQFAISLFDESGAMCAE